MSPIEFRHPLRSLRCARPIRLPYLVGALVALGLLCASLFSYNFAFYLQAVTDHVSGGRSFFKQWLGLAWVCLAFSVLIPALPSLPKIIRRISIFLTLFVYVGNLAAHFWYAHSTRTGIGSRTVLVAGTHMSANVIHHTHVFKSVLALFADLFHLGSVAADTGAPYECIFPWIIPVLAAVAILMAALSILAVLTSKEKEWTSENRWPLLLTYVVSSTAVTKAFIDGGLLSPDFTVFVPALFVCMSATTESVAIVYRKILVSIAITFLVVFLTLLPLGELEYAFVAKQVIGRTAFLTLVLGLADLYARKRYRRFHLCLIAAGLTMFLFRGSFFWYHNYRYLRRRLDGKTIYLVNEYGKNFPYPVVYRADPLLVHKFSPTSPETTLEFYRRNGIPPDFRVAYLVGRDCEENAAVYYAGSVNVLKRGVLSLDRPSSLVTSFEYKNCVDSRTCDFTYVAQVRSCVADMVGLPIIFFLHNRGAELFVLSPKYSKRPGPVTPQE